MHAWGHLSLCANASVLGQVVTSPPGTPGTEDKANFFNIVGFVLPQ